MPRPKIPALALLGIVAALSGLASGADAQKPKSLGTAEPAASAEHAPKAETAEPGSIVEHHAGTDKDQNILEPQTPLAIWTVVVFGGLMLVLGRYAWGPLSKALHDREHHMAQTLEDAERVKRESEALLAEHRALIAQAADQSRAILDEARKAAESTAAEIVRKAQDEAESARVRAEREISGARDQALMDIWDKTASLAVSVAGKVLSRDLNPDDQRRLVEVALSEMPTTNGRGSTRS